MMRPKSDFIAVMVPVLLASRKPGEFVSNGLLQVAVYVGKLVCSIFPRTLPVIIPGWYGRKLAGTLPQARL
jgi:hypothetical protein